MFQNMFLYICVCVYMYIYIYTHFLCSKSSNKLQEGEQQYLMENYV